MTNYVGYINAMLNLRDQRLREELAKQAQEQQMWDSMGKSISGIAGAMGKSFSQSKDDAMANQLMNNTIPRAQSANPALNARANSAAASMPGFYTGGEKQMDMMLKMGKLKEEQMSNQLSNQKYQDFQSRDQRDYKRQIGRDKVTDQNTAVDDYYQQQRLEAQKAEAKARADRAQVDDARAAAAATSTGMKDDFNNYNSYLHSQELYQKSIAEAPDKRSYDNAAKASLALYYAGQKRGLDVGDTPPAIPPYISPEQRLAIRAQQAQVATEQKSLSEAQSAQPGALNSFYGWMPGLQSKEETIKAAQDKYNMEQQTLQSMQKNTGEPYSPDAAGVSAAPAAPPATGNASPEGTVIDVNGQKMIKRGGKWVPTQ